MTKQADQMITVGRIVRPHGHRGSVVVEPETDFPAERFKAGAELFWRRGDAPETTVKIVDGREFKGRWIVALEGVADMNEAETLRGTELKVPVSALHPLEAGAHYVHDKLDLPAMLEQLTRDGDIVIALGAGDVNACLPALKARLEKSGGAPPT